MGCGLGSHVEHMYPHPLNKCVFKKIEQNSTYVHTYGDYMHGTTCMRTCIPTYLEPTYLPTYLSFFLPHLPNF